MEIANRADIGLVHRAIREGWNVDKPKVVSALMKALSDPDLVIEAAKVLLVADALDLKRERLEAKAREAEDTYRARLIRIAKTVPELHLREAAKLAGIELPSGPLFERQ
jgi:hypothetical protein